MFADLDSTLQAIVDDPVAPNLVRDSDASFATPDKEFAPTQGTLNFFLHDVKENRQLRDAEPIRVLQDGQYVERQPPLRVDCSYLVTAWSSQTGASGTAHEHQLLGQALAWLSRLGTIPEEYLRGGLVGQPFPPPTMVAQMDGSHGSHEFWSALGIPPRLGFGLKITVAVDLDTSRDVGPEVVARELRIAARDGSGAQSSFAIAGTVRDAVSRALIVNAAVVIDELARQTRTDMLGRYRFHDLEAGDYTLVARAEGFTNASTPIRIPGTEPDAYRIELSAS